VGSSGSIIALDLGKFKRVVWFMDAVSAAGSAAPKCHSRGAAGRGETPSPGGLIRRGKSA
jgi:hypothetical protein